MSRASCLAVAVLCMAGAPMPVLAQTPPAPPAPAFGADECAVWERELAFAGTVERHDAKAFAAFVHPGAVFNAKSPRPARGRDAIVRRWARIVDGTAVKLWWYPTTVAIGGEGDIAVSSGPALYEATDPKATPRYTLGGFQSVWHKGDDGTWRVLFDDGIEPVPATEADAAAFRAARRTCPQR